MSFKIQERELTGFGLAGYVHLNGAIKLNGTDRFIDAWPEAIEFYGATYTLEEVIDGAVDEKTGIKWQNAEYV